MAAALGPRLTARVRWWHVWIALLALSQVVELARSTDPPLPADAKTVEVAPQDAHGPIAGEPVRIAYREYGAATENTVVYLHGSPGSGAAARHLAPLLARQSHVIAPDLPGFGGSSRSLPDYGIDAHAGYVLELLDELGLERAHLVGHSMGSGVALHLADRAPERVASITVYGGIGVQEGEGSGDFFIEHLKYAAGYAALVVAPEFVPHFGLLGPRAARHAFIRNFWDSDQRPLRAILERMTTPLLILHGDRDPLVELWTAREHHRIVEHSELVVLDASHFLVFSAEGADRLAREIAPFLARHADPSMRPQGRTVDPQALGGAPTDSRLSLDRRLGPWVQMGLLVSATMVSEDLACIGAGLWARAGHVDLFVAVFGCVIGIFVGDLGLWVAGRAVGRRVLRWRWIARRVSPQHVERFGQRFDRHMGKAVFGSRFLPGTRVPLFLAAGVASRRPWAFAGWLLFAVLVWTPLLIVLTMLLGPIVARPFEAVAGVRWVAWLAAALLLFVTLRILVVATSWRGRARIAASVSRLWRPEFWPAWLYYLPLVPCLAWLAIRYGITTPTAANPAIPHGGFVGESKHQILRRLPESLTIPSHLVESGAPETRLESLREHTSRAGWQFPLVLKPDEGQRGAGLKLADSWQAVEAYLQAYELPVLAQPYDPGPHEAGVFYYRIPGQPRGWIFSVTDKRFPSVVGDGRSTLEDLILRDRRLRMQARVFLRRHVDRALDVPAVGEFVRLGVAGNHCQGTLFLDGAHLATADLERVIDAAARGFDGFFFGRFDVRYTSPEAFARGEGFRIVELNGVTSESTNIYDPKFGLLRGWRTLVRQWSLAFVIGAENRRLGHRASSLGDLWHTARRHYRSLPRGVSD